MTSYTAGLRLAEPVPGDPAVANVWGTILNGDFTLLDTAIVGTLSLDVSGGSNVVLTVANGAADQSRNANFLFTGTLTGDIIVLWPNGGGTFAVRNATTGAHALSCGVNNGSGGAAGAVVAVPQGGAAVISTGSVDASLRVDKAGIGAASAGENSDITSLLGLTTPLPVAEGGTGAIGGAEALINLGYTPPVLNSQLFVASGTFTIPAKATAQTFFKFTLVGAGAGAGGATSGGSGNLGATGGAGAGGAQEVFVSGFTPSTNVTVNIGSLGIGGAPGSNGSDGGDTTLVYGGQTFATSRGGKGSITPPGGATGAYFLIGGAAGTISSASVGGVTILSAVPLLSEPGSVGIQMPSTSNHQAASGQGGSGPFGAGGISVINDSGATAGLPGSGHGSAGSGAVGNNVSGGSGTGGLVLVEWVL